MRTHHDDPPDLTTGALNFTITTARLGVAPAPGTRGAAGAGAGQTNQQARPPVLCSERQDVAMVTF